MSQPFDATVEVPSLIELDDESGEFWVPNPWAFSHTRHNLSAYERNGVHLNSGGTSFLDVGYLSSADSDGDGRSIVAADISGDGMPELFVRQAGGGALKVYANRLPRQNWLRISLRGRDSNRQGIGSRVDCLAGDLRVRRELYPVVNFLSQSPDWVDIGIGPRQHIDRLTIRWPSGIEQSIEGPPINSHLIVTEGIEAFEVAGGDHGEREVDAGQGLPIE